MANKEHNIKSAEHFVRSSKRWHALRDTLRKIRQMHKAAKSEMDDDGGAMDLFDSVIDSCDAFGNDDAAHAEHYIECAKSAPDDSDAPAQKAAGMRDLDIRPDSISAVTPDAPSIRPVLRHGQREFGRPSVEPQFEHLTRIEE